MRETGHAYALFSCHRMRAAAAVTKQEKKERENSE